MGARPTAAIIGAGISGLTSGKMLTDYGIEYTCFESGDRVGGNWAFANPNGHSSAYRSLHIDTSKELLSFEDFPMPADYPDFPHHSEIKRYLDSYADAFGLRDRIRFETPVQHAERLPGGGWTLRTADGEHHADVLVVGNGHHWDPRLPGFPGTFRGESIHSHHYLSPTEPLHLKDKRVLVVGIGNSAADIISELSQRSHGNQVTVSTRSGAWVMPKYIFGQPIDKIARTLPHIPPAWQRRLVRGVPRLISGKPETYGLPRPNHHFLEAHPTVSSELLLRLGSGDASVKPDVERLDGDTVHFVDGSSRDFDAIIYATGYNISFPFFDPGFLSAPDNALPLYKRIFKPGLDDLLFIGFAQAIPTLFPFIENQTRLLGAYLAGHYRPPSEAEMEATILADQRKYSGHYADRPRHTQQVDYFLYVHDMLKKELPAGRRRAQDLGPVPLAGRTPRTASAAA
jgi:cation diffusion facilitator CzcD-associated flavoprotein CzcO